MSEPSPIGPLARRDGEPAFDEPWQAQVLALANGLVDQGVFTATGWTAALGAELERRAARGEGDEPVDYYAAALAALESLLASDGRVTEDVVEARVAAWRRAYLATPHGEPVALAAGLGPENETISVP